MEFFTQRRGQPGKFEYRQKNTKIAAIYESGLYSTVQSILFKYIPAGVKDFWRRFLQDFWRRRILLLCLLFPSPQLLFLTIPILIIFYILVEKKMEQIQLKKLNTLFEIFCMFEKGLYVHLILVCTCFNTIAIRYTLFLMSQTRKQ